MILVVVRGTNNGWASPGKLLLAKIDPRTGKLVKSIGPFLNIGGAPGPGGNDRWWSMSDWYRPSK